MQFAFNIMTRSRRVTYDNLQVRDPEFVERVDAWFARITAVTVGPRRRRRCSSRSDSAAWN